MSKHSADFKESLNIVVCGYNTFNAYGILRSLGEAGIKSDLITNQCPNPFLTKSKYVKEVAYFTSPDAVPEILLTRFKKEGTNVVICCDDPIQSATDLKLNVLSEWFVISNCKNKEGELTRLMDKTVQMEIAEECGLTIPKSWSIAKDSALPVGIIYPCIVKPLVSKDGTKKEINVCHNKEDLVNSLKDSGELIVQEFIEKDYEISIAGVRGADGDICLSGVLRKIRQYPDMNGLSSFGVLEGFEKYPNFDREAVKKFLDRLDYRGIFCLDMAVKGGKYYFFEINLRNGGKSYFSTSAGYNLPLIYVKAICGLPFGGGAVKSSYFMGETTDIKQVFKRNLSVLGWFRDLIRTNSFFMFNIKDPKPFFSQIFGKIKNRLA